MDFYKLKEQALAMKNKATSSIWKVIDWWVKKLQWSEFVIKKLEDLDLFVEKSKSITAPTGKVFQKRVIIIFAEINSDFYKSALYEMPILYTKTWSQNIALKMSSINISELKKYNINSIPCLVVFENKSIYKIIEWEENINKLVKWFSLDINKLIEDIN